MIDLDLIVEALLRGGAEHGLDFWPEHFDVWDLSGV